MFDAAAACRGEYLLALADLSIGARLEGGGPPSYLSCRVRRWHRKTSMSVARSSPSGVPRGVCVKSDEQVVAAMRLRHHAMLCTRAAATEVADAQVGRSAQGSTLERAWSVVGSLRAVQQEVRAMKMRQVTITVDRLGQATNFYRDVLQPPGESR